MGIVDELPKLVIGLLIVAILLGTVFIVGVGLLANGTKGSACTNCQATTKSLLQNTELILVLAVFIGIAAAAIGMFVIAKRG